MRKKLKLNFAQLEQEMELEGNILSSPMDLSSISGGSSIEQYLDYFRSLGFVFTQDQCGNYYSGSYMWLDPVTVTANVKNNGGGYNSYSDPYLAHNFWSQSWQNNTSGGGTGGGTGNGAGNGAGSTIPYGSGSGWSTVSSVFSGAGIVPGTITTLSSLESSLSELKFIKGVKVAGALMFGASAIVNIVDVAHAYQSGDPSAQDKAINAGIDIAVGVVCLATGGIGFVIGTAYYVLDESGYIEQWTNDVIDWWGN